MFVGGACGGFWGQGRECEGLWRPELQHEER